MGTPDTLRHHFRRRVGISPLEYRARFVSGAQERVATAAQMLGTVPPMPQPSRESPIAGID